MGLGAQELPKTLLRVPQLTVVQDGQADQAPCINPSSTRESRVRRTGYIPVSLLLPSPKYKVEPASPKQWRGALHYGVAYIYRRAPGDTYSYSSYCFIELVIIIVLFLLLSLLLLLLVFFLSKLNCHYYSASFAAKLPLPI